MNTLSHQCSFVALFFIFSLSLNAQIHINEWMASNSSVFPDEAGEYDDWIEIFNSSSTTHDISGWFLTDDPSDTTKFQIPTGSQIPANGYVIFWADNDAGQGNNHCNFKLGASGESISLFDNQKNLVDFVEFQEQTPDVSMGAFPEGSTNYFFFTAPTPGQMNLNTGVAEKLELPEFSLESGFYSSGKNLTISHPDDEVQIYYTLDGSEPSASDQLYSDPINIDFTSIVRAIAVKQDFGDSDIKSGTFFLQQEYELPVLSLITDPEHLYGPTGIYDHPTEEGKDWERFVQMEYFENENIEFSANAGIRIQGSSSVTLPKKSFRLFFKTEYGQKHLEYPMFEGNEVEKFRNLVLRGGYDDDLGQNTGTLLRDPLGSLYYKKLNGLCSDGKWAVITINGGYWGIYEIRESVNDHFIKDHTGFDDFDLVRFTKWGPEAKEGDLNDWDALTDLIMNNDLTDPVIYDQVKDKMAINNFIDFLAFTQLSGYKTWTWGASAYKEKSEDGQWKFTVWDMDRNWFDNGDNPYDQLANPSGLYWANFLPQRLLTNETFRNKFINRIADLMNSSFLPEDIKTDLQVLKNQIIGEVPDDLAIWGNGRTLADWELKVETMEYFIDKRPQFLRDSMLAYFQLPNTHKITIDKVGQGEVSINSLDPKDFPWTGTYFEDVPVELSAVADPGYIFKGWSNAGVPNTNPVFVNLQSTETVTAIFELGSTQEVQVVINEINYQSPEDQDAGDWIELYNNGNIPADLSGWIFSDESEGYFNLPSGTSLDTGAYLVIVENVDRFHAIYPDVPNFIGGFAEGEFKDFKLTKNGEFIEISNANKSYKDNLQYENVSPWPSINKDSLFTIQLVNADLDNSKGENWKAEHSTPGKENNLRLNQEIDFSSLPDMMALDAPIELFATSTSDLPVTFTIGFGPASIDGNVLTLDGVGGTVQVIASQNGNELYYPADEENTIFEINREEQVISFDEIEDKLPTDPAFEIFASSDSGLPITFKVINGPATVDNNLVTLTGETGEVFLRAEQSGNDTYMDAEDQFQNFSVRKLEQTIGIYPIDNLLTSAMPFFATAIASSGLPVTLDIISGPATISDNKITLTGEAGLVTVRGIQDGNAQYHPAPEVFESFEVVEVPKLSQSITFENIADQVANGDPFDIHPSASSGLEVDIKILSGPADLDGNTITLTGLTGEVTVRARQLGNDDYYHAEDVFKTFNVLDPVYIDQEISFEAIPDQLTTAPNINLIASSTSGLPVSFFIENGPATIVDNLLILSGEEGEVKVIATQLGDDDFYPAPPVTRVFLVSKPIVDSQTITFGSIEDQWTSADPLALDALASSGLPVTFEVESGPATVDGNILSLTGAEGEVVVRALQTGSNGFAPAVPVLQSFQVILRDDDFPANTCKIFSNNSASEWIRKVEINDYISVSGTSNFSDFSGELIDVAPESTVSFAVWPEFLNTQASQYIVIWVDFNRDGDFGDGEESVFATIRPEHESGSEVLPFEGSFVVPASARLGWTKMRVAMSREDFPNYCEDFSFGEVEDYGLNIKLGTAIKPTELNSKLTIFPIPTRDLININNETADHIREMRIYNNTGQLVADFDPMDDPLTTISIDFLNAGSYTLSIRFEDGSRRLFPVIKL